METLTADTFTDADAPTEENQGNISCISTARAEFHITDESSANWFLRKLANLENEKARVKAQAAKMIAEMDADTDRLRGLYEAELREFARAELERRGGRRKTLTLLQGSLSFRTVPASLRVDDAAAALDTAAAMGHIRVDEARYREAANEAQKTTGELLPGVVVVPERENFAIRFGKEADAS